MEKKILYRKIIHKTDRSYSYSADAPFTVPLHCHKEYELVYIVSGQGQEFIGDTVKRYAEGDLTLIGSDVPHLHLCDSVTDKSIKQKSSCDMLQFSHDIFPKDMASVPEYFFVNSVLEKSSCGIRFEDKETVKAVWKLLRNINRKNGIDRILALTKILDMLGKSKDMTLIAPAKFLRDSSSAGHEEPVNKTYSYLIDNFKNPIRLEDVAGHIKLNPASLCRYFKQSTGKTVFECLNEIRIEYACRLLSNSNLTVSQIAYEAGFNNLSHFNKQFMKIISLTPTQYREELTIDI